VSQRSLNTITGKVRVTVKLNVDPNGKVSNASLQSAGPSEYFARVALEASRRWKFDPPQSSGEATPSQWLLRYAFSRGGVEVHPEQLSR
jgi:TonB family protein